MHKLEVILLDFNRTIGFSHFICAVGLLICVSPDLRYSYVLLCYVMFFFVALFCS
jgi:hypothetical protein